MKKEIISERQGTILIVLFIIGTTFLIGSGGLAKQDAWIATLVSLPFSTLLLLIFSRILSLYPGKDLFDILELVMGKLMGKLISLLMIWYAFHLGALVIRNLSEFTNVLVFPDTPVIVPMIFFVILLIWGVKEGLEVLGRWSEFFIWIVIILLIFTSSLSVTHMDINRLKPILNNGFALVLKGAFSSFSFPFAEIIVFTMVFSNIAKAKSYTKTFMWGLMIGGFIIFGLNFRNILVLGSNLLSHVYFPSNRAVSVIHIGQLFQRLEITVSIVLLVCSYIKAIICLIAVCNGISKIFGFKEYDFIATPVALLMFSFSFILYRSTMEMVSWAFDVYPYYAFIFQVIIPLIIFITVEIKHKFP